MTFVDPKGFRTSSDSAERHLWAAIVAQAVRDLFAPDNLVTPADRAVALRWLTASGGQFARDRNIACAFVDIDGEVLREKVIAALNGAPLHGFIELRGFRDLPGTIEEARAMWRAEQAQPASRPRHHPPKIAVKPPLSDDIFYLSPTNTIRAARSWNEGETSRLIGVLPPRNSKVGEVLWSVTQAHRVGWNMLSTFGDPSTLIRELADSVPACEPVWVAKGERLPAYRLSATLRLYLKTPTSTSDTR